MSQDTQSQGASHPPAAAGNGAAGPGAARACAAPGASAAPARGTRPALWTRDYVLLILSTFALFVSLYFLMPTVPLFVSEYLGGDERTMGLVTGLFMATAVGFRPLGGYLMDRFGRRGVHLSALFAFALSAAGHGAAKTLGLLLAVRLVHGLPWGVANTAANTVAADLVPAGRRGEGMGYFGLGQTLAMAVGPLVALEILGEDRFRQVFATAGIIALVSLSLALLVRHPRVLDPGARVNAASLFERRVGWVSLATMIVTAGYGAVTTFIVVYGQELGIANPGSFFSVLAVGLILSRMTAGRAFDRYGPAPVVCSGLAFLALCYLLLWFGRAGFFSAAVAMGLGFGIVVPSVQAMAVSLVDPSRRGAAYATLLGAFDAGVGLGSYLLGGVARRAGFGAMYLCAGAVLAVPAIVFALRVFPVYTERVAALKHAAACGHGGGRGDAP